jgi:hypothetical protein
MTRQQKQSCHQRKPLPTQTLARATNNFGTGYNKHPVEFSNNTHTPRCSPALRAFISGATSPHYRPGLALSSTKFILILGSRLTASRGHRLRCRKRGDLTDRPNRPAPASLFTLADRSGERKSGTAAVHSTRASHRRIGLSTPTA